MCEIFVSRKAACQRLLKLPMCHCAKPLLLSACVSIGCLETVKLTDSWPNRHKNAASYCPFNRKKREGAAEATTAALTGEFVPRVKGLQVFKSVDASSVHCQDAGPVAVTKKELGNPLSGFFDRER